MKNLHINAMRYPLPLVRKGSRVEKTNQYPGGYVVTTNFGEPYGKRVAFFGSRQAMLDTAGEGGKLVKVDNEIWEVV